MRLTENSFIAEYLAPLAHPEWGLGLKDDAAFLSASPKNGLVVTADACVCGVHFFADDSPADVAYKALAVNISDLAAKGVKPLAYTLTLALPEAPTHEWACAFTSGLKQSQELFGIALIGGDTVSAHGAWWISIMAFGAASSRGIVPRGGAQPGDALYITGTLGDSSLGLNLRLGTLQSPLSEKQNEYLLERYLKPMPRTALSPALSAYASAAMDISDGLVLDLGRMCKASKVSAHVDLEKLPLSIEASTFLTVNSNIMDYIITGGDDYEILAAISAHHIADFEKEADRSGMSVTQVGTIKEGQNTPEFYYRDGRQFKPLKTGFQHF